MVLIIPENGQPAFSSLGTRVTRAHAFLDTRNVRRGNEFPVSPLSLSGSFTFWHLYYADTNGRAPRTFRSITLRSIAMQILRAVSPLAADGERVVVVKGDRKRITLIRGIIVVNVIRWDILRIGSKAWQT